MVMTFAEYLATHDGTGWFYRLSEGLAMHIDVDADLAETVPMGIDYAFAMALEDLDGGDAVSEAVRMGDEVPCDEATDALDSQDGWVPLDAESLFPAWIGHWEATYGHDA